MLRDRLRRWGMATKYRRHGRRLATGLPSSGDSGSVSNTQESGRSQSDELQVVFGVEAEDPNAQLAASPDNAQRIDEVLQATERWYGELWKQGIPQKRWGPCRVHTALVGFQQGLFAKQLDPQEAISWRLLRNAGNKFSERISDNHPEVLPSILDFLLDLPSREHNAIAGSIRELLEKKSRESLPPTHPVALLCSTASQPAFSELLCQHLLMFFEKQFSIGSNQPDFEALAIKIRLRCCDVYIKRQKFEKAERLLEDLEPDQDSDFALTKTYRTRANLRRARGDCQGALDILLQAWEALRSRQHEETRLGCKILADLAVIHEALGDLPSCEKALTRLLETHVRSGGDPETQFIITKQLEDALLRQGKKSKAIHLRRQHPEAFDTAQYYNDLALEEETLGQAPAGNLPDL